MRAGLQGEFFVWRRRPSAARPPNVIDRLNKAVNAAAAESAVKAPLGAVGVAPMPMTLAEFEKFSADETEKWGKVIRTGGIKVE